MWVKVIKLARNALIPQVVITSSLQASPDRLCTIPPISTRHNTLINPTIITCFNCRKKGHFILFYLKPKNINNIKEIKEEKIFNKLGKEDL